MTSMSDVECYRTRARQWQAEADQLPNGAEREVCLVLAKGYADLAALVEAMELSGLMAPDKI